MSPHPPSPSDDGAPPLRTSDESLDPDLDPDAPTEETAPPPSVPPRAPAHAATHEALEPSPPPVVHPPAPPEPHAATPEPDAATPEPDAATPEPGAATPAPPEPAAATPTLSPPLAPAQEPAAVEGLPPRPPWWRVLVPRPRSARNPASRVSRHLGYEVVVTVFGTLVAVLFAYVSLYGEFQDLYLKSRAGILGPADAAQVTGDVTLLTIGREALYLWNPEDAAPEVTPRALLAELVSFSDAAGARVIVLDHLLDEPSDGDDRLAAAARAHGAVIGAERFELTEPKQRTEFAAGPATTLGDALATGFANLQEQAYALFSGDLIARRTPLVRRVSRARLQGRWPDTVGQERGEAELVPSMALLAAWTWQARGTDPDATPADLLSLLDAHCGGDVLVCDGGAEVLGLPPTPIALHDDLDINFRGPEGRDGLPVIRASAVLTAAGIPAFARRAALEAGLDPEAAAALAPAVQIPPAMAPFLRDKIVVIGRVDAAAEDRFVTPYSFPLLLDADMAGVRIQSQIVDTLLSGRHIRHAGLALRVLLALGLVLGITWSNRFVREDLHSAVWVVVLVGVVIAGIALFRFTDGYVFDLGLPLTAGLGALTLARLWSWGREGA